MKKRCRKRTSGKQKTRPKTSHRPFDLESIGAEHLEQIQAYHVIYSAGHQKTEQYMMACVYGACLPIEDDEEEYLKLKGSPFFKDVRQLPDGVFQLGSLYGYKAKAEKKRNRVMRKAQVLERYSKEGLQPTEVEARLVAEGGIQNAIRLSGTPKAQTQSRQRDNQEQVGGGDLSYLDSDQQDQDQGDKKSAVSSLGQTKAARIQESKLTTSTTMKACVTLDLIGGGLLARQALKPGPATFAVMVEPQARLEDADWLEIRLISVKRRGK